MSSGPIHRLRIWFFNDRNLKWALDMSISLKFKENGENRNKKTPLKDTILIKGKMMVIVDADQLD
jgi:hypothetical protein